MVVLFTVLFELVAAHLCCTYTDLYKETSTMFCICIQSASTQYNNMETLTMDVSGLVLHAVRCVVG